jgi:cephalosporin-C deacetylase-like acetyl esterase
MFNNNKCKRCGEVETYKHLIWECREVKHIWLLFNEFATSLNQQEDRVLKYENIFQIGNKANMNKVKIKVIQGMIQVDPPVNWTRENIIKISNEIRCMELYNANRLNKQCDH